MSAWSSTNGLPSSPTSGVSGFGFACSRAPSVLVSLGSLISLAALAALARLLRLHQVHGGRERAVVGGDVGALLGLQRRCVQPVARGVAEADHAEHEPGAVRLPVDPAQLVGVGHLVEVASGLHVRPAVEQRLGDLAQRGHRGGQLAEVDVRVGLPAGVVGLRDVGVQQRPLRAGQLDLLVARVDLHPPRVGLAVDEVHRGVVVGDPVSELLDDVGVVRSESRAAPASCEIWLSPGLSAMNSGSFMIASGLSPIPGWPRPSSEPR